MTDSPYIHHRPTPRRLLDTTVVCPDLEHHQRGSSGVLLGLAAGRHRPVNARGGRSPPSCQPHPSCSKGCTVSVSHGIPKERRSIEIPTLLLTIVLFNSTAGLCRQPKQPFC